VTPEVPFGDPHLPVALVVGAGGGMGRAVARRLAERHRVLLADRDPEAVRAVAAAIAAEGGHAVPVVCEVTDPDSVAALAVRCASEGALRAVAHVVGLSPAAGDPRLIMAVNLVGTARVLDALTPLMAPGGAAVVVSSMAAHLAGVAPEVSAVLAEPLAPDLLDRWVAAVGEPTAADAYQHSKVGELHLVRRSAVRFAGHGARIVSLSPGMIHTPMGAAEFAANPHKYALFQRTPLAREGSLTEICDALEFLCSARASFITGTDLLVDGGLVAALTTA
jgi:NAD(P)-dependent dehydrogenase (short-subunit alcohol dehydrogenase family)